MSAAKLSYRRAPITDEFLPVIGQATIDVIELARTFVNRGETLVIRGPTGAGKSRLARWCHEHSPRKERRLEILDLRGIPEQRQLAELVGYERGAFSGATRSVSGALARAAKSTLIVNEIDELALSVQSHLSRILDDGRYRPLGDDAAERELDVQLIFTTKADLHAAVREGRFRADLHYRINVLPVQLPPLVERTDETPGWAAYMLDRCARGCPIELSPDAIAVLCRQPWPGNLRQLETVVRRACALALAEQPEGPSTVEEHHITRALGFEDEDGVGITAQLWRGAQAIAREALRREETGGEPFDLRLVDGFRGMVLGAAVQQLDSREEAFRLFGREHLTVGRNHHRALKRELQKTRELVSAFDDDVAPELQELTQLVGT